MSYYKSILHVMRDMADGAILDSNAPSIFDADDFSKDNETVAVTTAATSASSNGSNFAASSSSSSSNNGSSSVYDSGYVTATEFDNHENDAYAHQAQFAAVLAQVGGSATAIFELTNNLGTLSGTVYDTIDDLSGLSGTLSGLIDLVEDEYLRADKLTAGDNISVATGVDGNGRPTRSIALDIEKGVVNGSINGITAGPFSAGVNYEAGRVVNATLSNVTVTTAALSVSSVTTNGSDIQFYVNSGYSGTSVNSNFQIHWTMI